ncbi:MAG: GIY-YIG nuclease family protein [Anaerolineae bacterium]|nr:GIY-YIG nuclease family protein [Anaerolineae bacterium]MBN8655478.1 GIY-YIG nuclease family protein [Anaerolineae bacterium]
MNNEQVSIPLKRFLLVNECPPSWKGLDLYLFRDEHVAFYVGQSQLAFARVWEHLLSGFKGHSIVGRFIWCNWPTSMSFTIEMMSSRSGQFDTIGNDLNAAERQLIQHWSPCFNISLNDQPTSLPASYLPPNAPFRRRQGLNKLIHEAERAVKADDTRSLLESLKENEK